MTGSALRRSLSSTSNLAGPYTQYAEAIQMTNQWWRFIPGRRRKAWKLEKCRVEVLSSITGDRQRVELMAQRPRTEDDKLNIGLLETVLRRFTEIEASAKAATLEDELTDLRDDGELLALFEAYFCPMNEIQDEGTRSIDTMEGWGIPKSAPKKLRDLFSKKLQDAVANPHDARGALYSIFSEADAWSDFIDDYEDSMRGYRRGLSIVALCAVVLAATSLYFASHFSILILAGLLFAGAAGSSVSVMAKMPALDASLSGELDAYDRRVYTRIGVGIVASLIGCGLMAWGVLPISMQNQTFTDALNACLSPASSSGKATRVLTVLALAMLLGFSERALTSFEQHIFGEASSPRRKR